MNTIIKTGVLSIAALSMAACTTTQNVERDAVRGAAAGAAAGALIGAISGDVKVGEGAAAGAAVGGVIGAVRGNQKDKQMQGGTYAAPNLDRSRAFEDATNGRIYYYERGTNRTFYSNGEYRSG
ncbi:MAG: YMGG-like glycine zipper-containing protein [Pseudomonadota bacterium]